MTKQMKHILPILAVLLSSLSFSTAAGQPNVVLILADDLGYNALGCYGSPFVETPNIDRLAAGGQRWTRAYAGAPTCAPSRAVLISGQYSPRSGVYRVVDRHTDDENKIKYLVPKLINHLAADSVTLGEAFQTAGYHTGHFGKWHLGSGENHPSHHGFDVAIESHGLHFAFKSDPEPDPPVSKDTYLSDYLTAQALAFIDDSSKKQQPFFLYLPNYLIHKPLEAKQELERHYREKLGDKHPPEVATICAMTHALDESVGRIRDHLESTGLLDNTLIVFTSDNGGYKSAGDTENLWNLPLRSFKGQLYEGGIRVPAIFHWPGHIKSGSTTDEVLHFVDLYPTLLGLAGITPPKDHILDGISLHEVVTGRHEHLAERNVYWFFPKYAQFDKRRNLWKDEWRNTVIRGDHKLIDYIETDRYELFDLAADPSETKDLVRTHPELLGQMKKHLEAGKARFDSPKPVPNPSYLSP